jgi:phage shock protein A
MFNKKIHIRVERLFATIGASFEDFVAQVENHEAVAQSVNDEVRSNADRVCMKRKSLEKTRSLLSEAIHKTTASAACWRARAQALADTDRPKALECLRRAKALELELDGLNEQARWHQRSLTQLRCDLTALERKLRELELRRATLVSRHARARAEREFGQRCSRASTSESIF